MIQPHERMYQGNIPVHAVEQSGWGGWVRGGAKVCVVNGDFAQARHCPGHDVKQGISVVLAWD